jgi:GDP-mannose 6-dehydrogenase
MANVSVFGLGHVGCVTAASLAEAGHRVVGVDVDAVRVEAIERGRTPVAEPGLADLVAAVTSSGRFTATTDAAAAVRATDVALICVGTPGDATGRPDTTAIERAGAAIGAAVGGRAFTVVLRSTCLPGTTEDVLAEAVRQSAGRAEMVRFASNPEFLREGSARQDFARPPMVLVGCDDAAVADALRALYASVHAPFVTTSIRAAEAVKYASNAFHALKVCFANEVAAVCRHRGADADEVMRIFAMDRTLNISAAYLRPGFAFGGPCLAKDVGALTWAARQAAVDAPLLSAILPSNDRQIRTVVDAVLAAGRTRVGIVGFAFKGGASDLRGSPMALVARALIEAGCDVRIFDRHVAAATDSPPDEQVAADARDLAPLFLGDVTALLDHAELVVLGSGAEPIDERLRPGGRTTVIDVRRPATWGAASARGGAV